MHENLADWLHVLVSLHGCSDSERQSMVKVNSESTDYDVLATMTMHKNVQLYSIKLPSRLILRISCR